MPEIKIAVTEYNYRGNTNGNSSFEIMSGPRFLELYGKFDLEQLTKNGHYGDTLGQLRFYYARIVTTDGFEDSGYLA